MFIKVMLYEEWVVGRVATHYTTLPSPSYLTNSSAQREHNRRTDINTAVSSISVSRITKHSENLWILYAF